MSRYQRLFVLLAALALVAGACGRGTEGGEGGGEGDQAQVQRGGTLLGGLESDVDSSFDPSKAYYSVNWGYYHCCLLRTLVTTPTVPADEGGNEVVPDLAELPEVSEDGLTYTFTIKEGVMFGPPLSRQITSEDVITAFERMADPAVEAGYPFYYGVIEGFDDFSAGNADEISGIQAIDERTVEFTLARPAGDFALRLSMPATAPLPAEAVEGHEKDYGRFLVSSGPYMFEGSEDLDFSVPADEQEPVAGYVPGRSIVFVRNPDWDPATDEVRPAYVDRMEFQIGLTTQDMQDKIAAGELDINVDGNPPPPVVQEYLSDPEREDRVFVIGGDGVDYIAMNIAEPPFDDINVRKAVNSVIDKAALQQIEGGEIFGETHGHILIDSLLNDLLVDYDPYGTEGGTGDVDAAKEAMSQSEYDGDGDGVCDDPVCENVTVVIDEADPYPDQARVIQQNLAEIGIQIDINPFERDPMYEKCEDPAQHVPMCTSVGWYKDYADATTFGEPLFGSAAIHPSCCNYTMTGATPEQLQEFEYQVESVPSVDEKIEECDSIELGDERFQCWAEFDQQLMEEVVPWVPLSTINEVFIFSDRITQFQGDQFSSGPAFDKIALAPEGA